ncbi:MAG: GNAT family N-acetyltransferase [Acidimicrobiales bacterium]
MSEPAGGVRVVDNPADHRVEAWSGDQLAGLLAYREVPGGLNLVHTEVKPAFEGEGIAGRLVAAALDQARSQGLRVIPTCPYVSRYLERHPEDTDLVAGGGGPGAP